MKLLTPDAAYALWAPVYPPAPHNQLMQAEQDAMLALCPSLTGQTVLDAGCGTGRYLRLAIDRGARAVGVDRSPEMVSRARKIGPAVRGDLYALPIDTSAIDTVICGLALGDVSELALAIGELARVLKAGGTLVYSVVHPRGKAEGWSRTFDTPRGQFAVDGFWHSLEDHQRACAGAGLSIAAIDEPAIGGQPVALVVRAEVRGPRSPQSPKPEARSL